MAEQLSIAIYSGIGVAAVVAIKEVIMWCLNRKAHKEDAEAQSVSDTLENKLDQLQADVTTLTTTMVTFGEAQKRQDAGLIEMLSCNIDHLCDKYIQRNGVRVSELAALERMYEASHGLGGNGYLTHLLERVRTLPIIS